MLFNSSYLLLMLVAMVVGFGAQAFVNARFRRYSQVPLASGLSGAEVARRMLDSEGLSDVAIRMIEGRLSDNYDPRSRVLNLSRDVYEGRSVASAGVAAHEAGHAVQHAKAYAFAGLRSALVPAANIGSQLAWPLIIAGIFFRFPPLITIGALAFGLAVLFQLVTLPVEFDASNRAIAALSGGGYVPPEQVAGARAVLTAAALTYVAATLVSVMYLVYFLGLGRRS
jgi:uncharacterized protein